MVAEGDVDTVAVIEAVCDGSSVVDGVNDPVAVAEAYCEIVADIVAVVETVE